MKKKEKASVTIGDLKSSGFILVKGDIFFIFVQTADLIWVVNFRLLIQQQSARQTKTQKRRIMENFEPFKKIEKEFNVTIAYFSKEQDKPKFVMISDGTEIEQAVLQYQEYPKIGGFYVLTKANCENENCRIGSPSSECVGSGIYCKAKCAVWFYHEFSTWRFIVKGERLLSFIKGEVS